MKNKILIDAERTRYLSGISVICRNLINGLHQLQNKNFEFLVYADENKFQERYIFKKWKFWHKFFHIGLGAYDLVHIFHQANDYFPSKLKAKKIVTLHDLNFLHENLSDKKINKNIRKVQQTLNNADGIICISNFVKKDFLEKKHLLNINSNPKIKVIYNGLIFPDSRNFDLGKYSFIKEIKYILNIGVLFDKKNQLSLVEMLPFIEEDLVLIASGEKEPYATVVRKRIKELNLENRVHFLKNISEEEKYALIQNCESMCHPSIAEGFGIPPIEAMAFGKPVFLSTFTSLPEIGGDCAFYFEDFNPKKMADFYNERMKFYNENNEKLIPKIKNWTLQFDYLVMSKNYLDFYEKILSEN